MLYDGDAPRWTLRAPREFASLHQRLEFVGPQFGDDPQDDLGLPDLDPRLHEDPSPYNLKLVDFSQMAERDRLFMLAVWDPIFELITHPYASNLLNSLSAGFSPTVEDIIRWGAMSHPSGTSKSSIYKFIWRSTSVAERDRFYNCGRPFPFDEAMGIVPEVSDNVAWESGSPPSQNIGRGGFFRTEAEQVSEDGTSSPPHPAGKVVRGPSLSGTS